MGRNFLPRDVREWLPPKHLDLSAFENSHRDDGRGEAASPPASLIALLPYCYSKGVRSSRHIERARRDDVGCRIITANRRVDHSTVTRFVRRQPAAPAPGGDRLPVDPRAERRGR
ncbi:transposase [Streptomyces sp. MBT65]|uniref:transposase n=1 Tax=Streptomyces sp. MBT65 TaxID=1488395 RepID=UPI0035B43EFE